MKKSIAIGIEGVPLPMIMFTGDLENSFRSARDAGYDAVELYLPAADAVDARAVRTLMKRYELEVASVVAVTDLVQSDVIMGHPDAAVRKKFLERAHGHLGLAGELGAKVPIGYTHGTVRPGSTREELESWFFAALPGYIEIAASYDVTLILEPINRYEVDYINRVEEALRVLDLFPAPNLAILADAFHMNIEEASIVDAIRLAGDRIGHFHFVDSNRWPPGYGHTDLREVYRELVSVGYDGYLGVEAMPRPSSQEGARSGLRFIEAIEAVVPRR